MSFSVTSAYGSKFSDNFSSNSTPSVDRSTTSNFSSSSVSSCASMFDDIALCQPMLGTEESDTSLFSADDNGFSLEQGQDKFIPDAMDKNYADSSSDLQQTPQAAPSTTSNFSSSSMSSSASMHDESRFLLNMQRAVGIIANTSLFSLERDSSSSDQIHEIDTFISNELQQEYEEDYALRESLWAAVIDYCEMTPIREIYIKYSELKDRLDAYITALKYYYEHGLTSTSSVFADACEDVNIETFRFLTRSISFHEKQGVYAKVLANGQKIDKDESKKEFLFKK